MKRILHFASAAFAAALIALFSAPAFAQTPTPTPSPSPTPNPEDEVIKVETELVNLNVRVVDRNNRPVAGLKRSDFTIYEDNVPQQIEFFSQSEVPTRYSLVIDNSGSLRGQIDQVINAGKVLVHTNKDADKTSVIRFISSDKIEVVQEFTSNKQDIDDALDNLYIEGGQTAIIDAVYLAAQRVAENERKGGDSDRTRRALILVTDGEDRDSYYKEAQLMELLRETDVQIYVIGFVNDLSKDSGFIRKSPRGKAKDFLERLATQTGGKVYFPNSTSELDDIARNISSELRTQYSIGYIPSNDRSDGTFRNIKVTVADGPDKQKRIALTRSGRTADGDGQAPVIKTSAPVKKAQ